MLPRVSTIRVTEVPAALSLTTDLASGVPFEQPFKDFRERWIDRGEREYVRRLLDRHGRNVAFAAEEAGLDRTYLYRLIRKHGL